MTRLTAHVAVGLEYKVDKQTMLKIDLPKVMHSITKASKKLKTDL